MSKIRISKFSSSVGSSTNNRFCRCLLSSIPPDFAPSVPASAFFSTFLPGDPAHPLRSVNLSNDTAHVLRGRGGDPKTARWSRLGLAWREGEDGTVGKRRVPRSRPTRTLPRISARRLRLPSDHPNNNLGRYLRHIGALMRSGRAGGERKCS